MFVAISCHRIVSPMLTSLCPSDLRDGAKAVENAIKALQSDDARVRRAGLQAISGETFWG